MNIPSYDAWRLQGPPESDDPVMEECEACGGTGVFDGAMCIECQGSGEVEAEIEEPDGDYLYEKMRDARFVE